MHAYLPLCVAQYGLGNSRTLAEFEAHTGVCFAECRLSECALYGGKSRADFAGERAADALALVQQLMAAARSNSNSSSKGTGQ